MTATSHSNMLQTMRTNGWELYKTVGFFELIGPLWTRDSESGQAQFAIKIEPKHANLNGVAHGGVIMSFADQSFAVANRKVNPDFPQATIQLDMNFLSPVLIGGLLQAECEIVHSTRSMVFARATYRVEDQIVGSATAIFKKFTRGFSATPDR